MLLTVTSEGNAFYAITPGTHPKACAYKSQLQARATGSVARPTAGTACVLRALLFCPLIATTPGLACRADEGSHHMRTQVKRMSGEVILKRDWF